MTSAPPCCRALLAALLWLFCAVPLSPVAAQSDAYSATVTVDASSDNVAKARDSARVDGARRALDAVVAKLAGSPDKVKPLKLSDNQVTDLVASFEVANEKMSAVRYVADYTYHFKPADVAKVMQNAGIAMGGGGGTPSSSAAANPAENLAGKTVVVLPVYQDAGTTVLWDDPNPWREAWAARPAPAGGSTLLVPLGDVSDLSTIDADKARTGDPSSLAAIAKKEGGDEVLVMLATRRLGDKPGADVTVKRYRGGQLLDTHSDAVDVKPNEADVDLFRRASDTIVADIQNGWKNAKVVADQPQGSLVLTTPITGLDDWIKLRDSLSALPSVQKINVKSLSRQEATIEIQYAGSLDQLKTNLNAAKLDLQGGDPAWRLARPGQDKP